ncbi:hypothetical protein AX16_010900 [Volvariella volvacea WC 439]|nr:hypothetical protein AX16_010900 [Volvariella volvacea WC 439]
MDGDEIISRRHDPFDTALLEPLIEGGDKTVLEYFKDNKYELQNPFFTDFIIWFGPISLRVVLPILGGHPKKRPTMAEVLAPFEDIKQSLVEASHTTTNGYGRLTSDVCSSSASLEEVVYITMQAPAIPQHRVSNT